MSILNKAQLNISENFLKQNVENGFFDVLFEIDGKKLYAHKNILAAISKPFEIMFSEKWTSKDEPIELNQYSYENYKELLTFIYSGTCELNDNNIISIVDMAEMYEIIDLKEYCDDNFPSQNFDNTNVFNWIEFANKYSLTKLNEDLEEFVKPQFCELLESDQFFLSNKFVIEGFVKYAGDLGQAENEQCFNKKHVCE